MVSFDYDAQAWLHGDEAVREHQEQLVEERQCVAGPRGAEYLLFVGDHRGVVSALADIDDQLARLADRISPPGAVA